MDLHHDPHGAPPLPDGDQYPCAPASPLPRRQLLPGLIVAGIVLVVMALGIAGWLS